MSTTTNASDAAHEALEFIADVYDAEYVLNEFFDYMDIDRQIEFVRDFIKYHDVDTSEMNDETLCTIEEHYRRHC